MNSLLTFVLSLSLVLSPYAPALAQTDPVSKCAPGEIYNSFSKKCIGSEESRALSAEADQECNVVTDPQLRANCVNSRVTEKTSRAEENGDMAEHSSNISKIKLLPIFLAFATLYAGVLHLVKKPSDCKAATSSYAMIGGAVTILATEAMTKLSFTKELKKSQEELDQIVKGSSSGESDNVNATDLQAQIFDALIKRENGVIQAAEGKKKGYSLAKLMFLAATAMAGFEVFKHGLMISNPTTAALGNELYVCDTSSSKIKNPFLDKNYEGYAYIDFLKNSKNKISFAKYANIKMPNDFDDPARFQARAIDSQRMMLGYYSSISLDDYNEIKLLNKKPNQLHKILSHIKQFFISEAYATAGGTEVLAAGKTFQKLFLFPATRLALSGLMTTVTMTLTGHADKEIKKAKKRIEVLEKLKSQVTEAGPAVKCANGTERGKSGCEQIAPTTIKPGESTFALSPTQANGLVNTTRSSPFAARGCASSNGQPDPACGCKRNNSCFSLNSNFKIGNIPAANILGTGISDLNSLNSGEISPADLNSESIGRQLAAAGKLRDKVLADINKDPKLSAEAKKAQDAVNGLQRQLFNSLPANSSGLANSLALGADSDLSGLSGNEVLEKVKEELKESSAPTVTNEAIAGSGESDFNFDLGAGNPMDVGTGLSEGEGSGTMNINDFELADSEINPSSTTNLFDILSSRYKKSAFRRLLKADKEIAPEAPAEREIND